MGDVKVKKDYKRIIILASCYFAVLLLVGVLVFSFVVFSITKIDEEKEGVVCRTISDDRLSDLDIDEGDLIIAQKEFDYTKIQEGDVITFSYVDDNWETVSLTAKVTDLIEEPNSTVRISCYKVTGQDEYVHPNQVEAVYSIGGEVVGKHYKNIGGMIDFMRSPWGYVVFVVIPAVVALGIVAIAIFFDYYYLKSKKEAESLDEPSLEEEINA